MPDGMNVLLWICFISHDAEIKKLEENGERLLLRKRALELED
jgi:hypothetical protein